ncbi:hypothetical protein [Paenibacillus agricola]|uniref:hypothetical protein n=1 Tax=Paenibacillus agricola TaxID=2716264 RepID=UPI0028934639|nr:hypothetical protein [Paenibacillus agricola]
MSLDELLKDLQGQNTVQEDPNFISLDELFNDAFMSKHSSLKTFAAFLEKGNFQVKTQADINNIHAELFERHIVRETDFANWKSMLETANKEYAGKK